MKTYTVTFQPDNRTVRAAAGRSLLEAAKAAGIAITNVCNGDSVCGKCRVLVKSGKVTAKPTMFLDRHDIQRGAALACQTYVAGDVVVEVPPESRMGGIPILAVEDVDRFGKVMIPPDVPTAFPPAPLVRKICVELPPPTLDDSLPDQERVYRALREGRDIPVMQTGLAVLRRLPEILRRNDYKVTALLGSRGGTVEVVDVEPGDTAAANYGVAADIGTTTIVAHLVDMVTGKTLAANARYNSQSSFGEDIISRIIYAASPAGLRQLQETVISDLNGLISALVVDAGVRLADVQLRTVRHRAADRHQCTRLRRHRLVHLDLLPVILHGCKLVVLLRSARPRVDHTQKIRLHLQSARLQISPVGLHIELHPPKTQAPGLIVVDAVGAT